MLFESCFLSSRPIIANPLMYNATSNNMKLVHWPLMAGGGFIWYSEEGTGQADFLWVGFYIWYSEGGLGGAAARSGPSLLYQM